MVFQWSSAGLEDETVVPARPSGADYAHINSIALAPDGDVIASFRHLSAVLRIATSTHDGFEAGDVVWKLGGGTATSRSWTTRSAGPAPSTPPACCPNGHVLVFDDGSDDFLSSKLCVDQADPTGPAVDRSPGRAGSTEYALDTRPHTATLVWDYTPPGRYTWFMGSAARLANGDTLVGWAAAIQALASEVDAGRRRCSGSCGWRRRRTPHPAPHLLPRQPDERAGRRSRPRSTRGRCPVRGDATPSGQQVAADFSCTDRGGSRCRPAPATCGPGGLLDTSTPGAHTRARCRRPTVPATPPRSPAATPSPRRTSRAGPTTGCARVLRGAAGDHEDHGVVNDGTYADTFALAGSARQRRRRVRYKVGRTDVTAQVRAGARLRTPAAPAGASRSCCASWWRGPTGPAPGHRRTFKVRATSRRRRGAGATSCAVVVRAPAVASLAASAPRAARGRTT